MRSYVYKTVPSIHLFPAISGRGEVEKEESSTREWHNTFGIEIIGEHKEQTKQLGEWNRKENSCVVSHNERNDEYQRI